MRSRELRAVGLGIGALILGLGSCTRGADAVKPGELIVEPSTLHCLGFEWLISGDDDRDAKATVSYRAKGEEAWKPALPLFRVGGEHVYFSRPESEYVTEPMFAGSIFGLRPGQAYEVRLALEDPDGGGDTRTVSVRTKAVPQRHEGGRKLHVYPKEFAGKRETLAFDHLQSAFDASRPGDQILLHAGTYVGHYVFPHGGAAEKPIAIRAAGDGEVVLVNDRHPQMFDVHRADYLMFEDLTFRDPGTGDGGHTVDGVVLWAGNRWHGATPGCKGLTVRRCIFEDFGVGVMGADTACRGFTITDNRFLGRQDWTKNLHGANKYEEYNKCSWTAVWISGEGHDVGYNLVRGFRDGLNISKGWHGKEEPVRFQFRPGRKNAAIDFYHNDIMEVGDDFVETDSGTCNIRVYANRCTNSGTCGLSAQPVYGGPVYLIRNTVYNVQRHVPLKFNCEPAGVLVYHNTFIEHPSSRRWSNCHFRNNIILGLWRGYCLPMDTVTDHSSLDYNAYLPGRVYFGMPKLGWANREKWQLKLHTWENLAAFARASGYETHGVTASYDIFEGKMVEGQGISTRYSPSSINFTLRKDAVVVDAGCRLPNINDGYTGEAPDLGAWELGVPVPHYGPRP